MSGTIQTISDKTQFDKIFYNYFVKSDVYLKTSNGNMKIAFLGYTDGFVAFKIPYIKSMPPTILVFARCGETTIYLELLSKEKQEEEVFVFSPVKMQLILAARKEDRAQSEDDSQGKSLLFVTNVMIDFLMYEGIRREKKRVDAIRDKVLSDLRTLFSEVDVYFCDGDIGDPRMQYFIDNGNNPIFISDMTRQPTEDMKSVYGYYRENIYSREQFNMKRKKLISEISVPVLFQNKLPLGYLQVNNTVPIQDSYLQILKRAADIASQLMLKSGCFSDMCRDRLLVSDLSRLGNGMVFKDRKFIRYFKEKSIVCYDIIFPDQTVVNVSSFVRNISFLSNKIIKVGCEIKHIDQQTLPIYENYVTTHAPAHKPESESEEKKEPVKKKTGDELVG